MRGALALSLFLCLFHTAKHSRSRRPNTLVPGDDRYHGLDKVMHYLFNHVVVNKPSDPVKDLIDQVESCIPFLPVPPLPLLPILPPSSGTSRTMRCQLL